MVLKDLNYNLLSVVLMSRNRLKLKDVTTEIIKEDNGSFAIACSALGVYSVGRTLKEAKKSFQEALDLHLASLREKAVQALEASG